MKETTMRSFGFSAVLALALTGSAYAQTPTVRMIEIGTPEPGQTFYAVSLNRHGTVLGIVGREGPRHLYKTYTWTRSGGFRFIMDNAEPYDINDRGTIVGVWNMCGPETSCEPSGFMWTPSGGVTDLGRFNPSVINEKGSMAGFCWNLMTECARIKGRTYPIPELDSVYDINERDVVVGHYHRAEDAALRAALWTPSLGLRDLDPASEPGGIAHSINDSAIIAGYSLPDEEGTAATLWTPLGRAEIRGRSSAAFAVSNRGWIVGRVDGFRPALWLLGPRLVLLPVPDGAEQSPANAALYVNDAGHIVGRVWVNRPDGRREVSILWIVQ
jgi:hypothetical protein